MSLTEIAWAAGLFDGEGCSFVRKKHGKNSNPLIVISIHQKTREVLDRFLEAVEVGHINGNPAHSRQATDQWQYSVSAQKAHLVMEKIFPYLSIHKKEQYNKCVKYMKENCVDKGRFKFIPDYLE